MKRKSAFTLVEMLIVVVIIGILAAALIPKLVGAQEKARDTARKWNLNNANTYLTQYFGEMWVFTGTAGNGATSTKNFYPLNTHPTN